MDPLKLYLLAGLIAHKVYWEFMKFGSRHKAVSKTNPSFSVRLIKGAKTVILLGIVAQTVIPWDIVPIAENASSLRFAGVVLFTLGLGIAIAGRAQLGKSWADIETPTSVSKPALVSSGLYRYIRHPIYTGDLLLLIGLELTLNSWFVLLILLLAPPILMRAVTEERLLLKNLDGYQDYCKRTKRFLPFVA